MHLIHVNIPCWDPSLCSEDTSHGAKDAFAELSPVLPFVQTAWVQSYLRFALPSPPWGWQFCVSSFPCCFVPAWLNSVWVSSETRAITGRLAVLGCSPGQLPSPVCRSQPCKRMLMLRLRAYVTALPPLEFPVSPWD